MSIYQTYKLKTDVTLLNKSEELIIFYKKAYKINTDSEKITELSRVLEYEFTLDDFKIEEYQTGPQIKNIPIAV